MKRIKSFHVCPNPLQANHGTLALAPAKRVGSRHVLLRNSKSGQSFSDQASITFVLVQSTSIKALKKNPRVGTQCADNVSGGTQFYPCNNKFLSNLNTTQAIPPPPSFSLSGCILPFGAKKLKKNENPTMAVTIANTTFSPSMYASTTVGTSSSGKAVRICVAPVRMTVPGLMEGAVLASVRRRRLTKAL